MDDFTVDHGFELLEKTCNTDPEYPTACSMVFDPQNKEVYIVVHRDFTNILKLSNEDGTIETWKGFNHSFVHPLQAGDEGVLVSDLLNRCP